MCFPSLSRPCSSPPAQAQPPLLLSDPAASHPPSYPWAQTPSTSPIGPTPDPPSRHRRRPRPSPPLDFRGEDVDGRPHDAPDPIHLARAAALLPGLFQPQPSCSNEI